MNKLMQSRIGTLLIAAMTLSFVSCGKEDTSRQGIQGNRLPPCSGDGSIFAEKAYDDWKETYHSAVSEAIESHLQTLNSSTELPLRCTEADYENLVPASEKLKEIAGMLPVWREDSEALDDLSEADIAPVMLEFLRVYECALREREMYLSIYILQDEHGSGSLTHGDFANRREVQDRAIRQELRIARPTLERTLALIGGYDRLRPLALDIECIKRASLDLRNVLGLAADAAACLPKAWDTHGSLRDLPDPPPAPAPAE